MIISPHGAVQEPSGLHSPTWFATEQEYCTVLYWAIVANRLQRILEIGTNFGHSTWWWVEAAKKVGGHVITVDVKQRYIRRNPDYLTQVECASDDFWQHQEFDFIYVDGGHDFDQAYRDIVNAVAHIAEGGIVAVHDTAYANEQIQVRAALDKAMPKIGGHWMHFSQGKGISIGEY